MLVSYFCALTFAYATYCHVLQLCISRINIHKRVFLDFVPCLSEDLWGVGGELCSWLCQYAISLVNSTLFRANTGHALIISSSTPLWWSPRFRFRESLIIHYIWGNKLIFTTEALPQASLNVLFCCKLTLQWSVHGLSFKIGLLVTHVVLMDFPGTWCIVSLSCW